MSGGFTRFGNIRVDMDEISAYFTFHDQNKGCYGITFILRGNSARLTTRIDCHEEFEKSLKTLRSVLDVTE